jgi:hypothetical protein
VSLDVRGCRKKGPGVHNDAELVGVDGQSSEDMHVELWEMVRRDADLINGWHNG